MTGPPTYDLFVSYAEADRAWVEGYLLDALRQAGVRSHSEAAFALGIPRLLEFERAIKQSRRTLLVLTPAYLIDTFSQFADLLAQSYGLETATWPVIPLVLCPVSLPSRLSMLTALDATNAENWPPVIERLCAELHRPAPGLAPRPSCPYLGMAPFSEQDARYFFGREHEIAELRRRLRHQNYQFVIGPSGSGKSSLVFAGLVPELHRQQPGEWVVKIMRPGHAPLEGLGQVFDGVAAPEAGYAERVTALLAESPGARRLLVIVDQFEELFAQTRKPDQTAFIAALTALRQLPNCVLVPTMRADFYEDLMSSDLWPVDASQRLEIAPLRGTALRDALAKPAEDLGVYLEAGLLERLLADAADEPGVLPLVQETMVLLWDKMVAHLLPVHVYERLGYDGRSGLAVAIAAKADAVLAALPPQQQTIARRIFLWLIQFGEGRPDTRRQQPINALQAASDDRLLFQETLQHLTNNRLLTLTGGEDDTEQKVDIAHEALIAGWPTLQELVRERREMEQARRRLEAQADEWSRLGCGRGGLLDDIELPRAELWLSTFDTVNLGYSEMVSLLVRASRAAIEESEREREATRQRELEQAQALAEEQRRRADEQAAASRRLRRRAVLLAGALVGALIMAVAAGWSRYSAIQSEQLQRARWLVSEGQRVAEENPRLGLRLALEGVAAVPKGNPDAHDELVDAVNPLIRSGRVAALGDDVQQIYATLDGSHFVLVHTKGPSELWRTADGTRLITLPGKVRENSVMFSQDMATTYFTAAYVDTPGYELRRTSNGALIPLSGQARAITFSPDLSTMYFTVSYNDYRQEVRRTLDNIVVMAFTGVRDHGIAFSPNEGATYMAVSYQNRPTELWNIHRQKILFTLDGPVNGVSFSPDPQARYFVVNYDDRPAELHQIDGALITILKDKVSDLDQSIFFRPGSADIVGIHYADGTGELRRTADGTVITFLPGKIGRRQGFQFSPGGATYVTVTYSGDEALRGDERIALLRSETGSLVASVKATADVPPVVEFSADPEATYFTVYNSLGGVLRRTADGTLVTSFTEPVNYISFSPGIGAPYVVVGHPYQRGELWRTATSPPIAEFAGEIYYASFPSAVMTDLLIVRYWDQPGELWELEGEPRPLAILGQGLHPTFEPVIDTLSRRLILLYSDNHAHILDVAWLQAMGGEPERLSEQERVMLACDELRAGGVSESELAPYLNGRPSEACQ